MKLPGSSGFSLVLACGLGMIGVYAQAATPSFTVAATNVTMPGGGNPGTSQFTLASVNGYSGKLVVNSQYSGGDMNAKPPNCGIHTAPLFTLNSNSTVSGTLTCYPYGKVVPIAVSYRPLRRQPRVPVIGFALAIWLLFGRRARAGARRWMSVLLLGAISAAALSACGGNGLSGTYPFTVTATDSATQASVSTSITVTVP